MKSKQLSAFQAIAYIGQKSQIHIWLLKKVPNKAPKNLSSIYEDFVQHF